MGPSGGAFFGAGTFGMHDAATGRHPVHLAGANGRGGAETVTMHDFAVEQVSHRGKPDMRMRPHVEAVAGAKFSRAEMVEENKRPDHSRARRRQCAPHREAVAKIDGARRDHLRDCLAGIAVAGAGVFAREETHGGLSLLSLSEQRDYYGRGPNSSIALP